MDYSAYKQIDFRRKFWKLVGAHIDLFASDSQQPIGAIKMKAWKLREDIRLFAPQSEQEVLRIAARQIIDFGATYDVFDSAQNLQLFALRRKGLKSTFVRDSWEIQDVSGQVIGTVRETSGALALARRWLEVLPFGDLIGLVFSFVTQSYMISLGDAVVGTIVHRKNPFIVKMHLDTSMAAPNTDARLGISVAALLSVIDAAKNN